MGIVLMGVGGLLWLGGFAVSFVMALKSKRLSTMGIVLGVTTFWCGCGTLAFLGLAWNAMQKGVFAEVAAGKDPAEARTQLGTFKLAAGATVVGLVMLAIGGKMSGY